MSAIQHWCKRILFGAGLAVFGCSLTSPARTVSVGVANGNMLLFFPATTNIAAGDSVLWTWNSTGTTAHSTTSNTGLWDSTAVPAPHTFTNTFSSAGTFPYHCIPHQAFGMIGTIVVTNPPNPPPTVAITNPAPGAVFAAPASLTIQATAADDGAVTNVQFRVGTTVVTNQAAAPFAAITNSLAAGSYTLFAIASDNNGATATNQVAITVVNPVALSLSAPQPVPPAMFRFSYTANAGLSYIIQRSTNLVSTDWTTLVTNLAGSGLINFTDVNTTLPDEYYRVGRLPNP